MRADFLGEGATAAWPRQDFPPGAQVRAAGAPADRLLVVLAGGVRAGGRAFGPGEAVEMADFLAGPDYRRPLVTPGGCTVAHLPRAAVREAITATSPLTWTLARALALELRAGG
jgi:hypothetical protein